MSEIGHHFSIKDTDKILMDWSKAKGFTTLDNLVLTGYEVMEWEDFIEMENERLGKTGETEYNIEYITQLKGVLETFNALNTGIKVRYRKHCPVIIDFGGISKKFVLLLAAMRFDD